MCKRLSLTLQSPGRWWRKGIKGIQETGPGCAWVAAGKRVGALTEYRWVYEPEEARSFKLGWRPFPSLGDPSYLYTGDTFLTFPSCVVWERASEAMEFTLMRYLNLAEWRIQIKQQINNKLFRVCLTCNKGNLVVSIRQFIPLVNR